MEISSAGECLKSAGTALQNGNPKAAKAWIRRLAIAIPDRISAYTDLVEIEVRLGDWEAVIRLIARAVSFVPANSRLFEIGSRAAREAGNWRAVPQFARRALILKPSLDMPYRMMGVAIANDGDAGRALPMLRAAFVSSPNSAINFDYFMRGCVLQGDFAMITHTAKAVVARHPGRADAAFWLGRGLWKSDEVADADRHLERALAIDPSLEADIRYVRLTATVSAARRIVDEARL